MTGVYVCACAAGDEHDVAGAGLAGAAAEQHGALAAAAAVPARGARPAAGRRRPGAPQPTRARAHARRRRPAQREWPHRTYQHSLPCRVARVITSNVANQN